MGWVGGGEAPRVADRIVRGVSAPDAEDAYPRCKRSGCGRVVGNCSSNERAFGSCRIRTKYGPVHTSGGVIHRLHGRLIWKARLQPVNNSGGAIRAFQRPVPGSPLPSRRGATVEVGPCHPSNEGNPILRVRRVRDRCPPRGSWAFRMLRILCGSSSGDWGCWVGGKVDGKRCVAPRRGSRTHANRGLKRHGYRRRVAPRHPGNDQTPGPHEPRHRHGNFTAAVVFSGRKPRGRRGKVGP
jgi:hypothetical protein